METVKEKVINNRRVEVLSNAKYEVVTVVPLVENPVKKTYIFSQEELNSFLEGYNEVAEFIVNVKPQLVE